MKYSKRLQTAIAISLLLASAPTYAADPEYDFIGINVLDSINAQAAYNQGYTGAGINVGVCDLPTNFAHPDLRGEQVDNVDVEGYDWGFLNHGTFISGIVAATKNGIGMHGVAYDAYVIAGSPMTKMMPDGSFSVKEDVFKSLLSRPEVKVINNSWGNSLYITEEDLEDDEKHRNNLGNMATFDGIKKASNADKLLVFAAGNSGHITSAIEANLCYLYRDESASNNLVNVVAGDSNSFKRRDDGGFDVDCLSTAVFADLSMFSEDRTLVAPGFMVSSANSNFAADGKEYEKHCGSSIAAPVVTGVGALVQQAFPYLGGKLIGDVLLSIANNKITNTDGFYLTVQEDFTEDGRKCGLNILFTGDTGNPQEAIKTYISNIVNKKQGSNEDEQFYYLANYLGGDRAGYKDITKRLKEATEENLGAVIEDILTKYKVDVEAYYNTPEEMIFGQGMVDAGAAVKGLGAINVRRLSKNDISYDYTVAGKTEKQALYTVDTMGWDSVWSNDIKEIRAGYIAANPLENPSKNLVTSKNDTLSNDDIEGLEDLQKRYEYYKQNWLDELGKFVTDENGNIIVDEDGNKIPLNYSADRVKDYVDYFNKNVADSGLAGLHAGLVKDGEGILALAGDNTYKGSSIARGGVLQIDGSVAGDAYSEGAGTIAGSGTISGNMYNNGQLMAGSALVYNNANSKNVQNTLTIAKDLTGSGTIVVNQYASGIGKIQVTGKADISKMEIQAGALAAPDMQGEFITAGTLTGNGKAIDNFSGLLDATTSVTGNTATITTKADNNTGGNHNTFVAVNELYDIVKNNADDKKVLQQLYGLQKEEAAAALAQMNGGLHLDLAHDALQNRDVRLSMEAQENLEREDSLWGTMARSWHNSGSLNGQSYTMTLGKDFVRTADYYAGAFFSYSDNSLSGANGKGEYDNYSVAFYAATQNKPQTISGYLGYGLQDNDVKRFVNAGDMHKLSSDYDSSTISAGVKYSYDLHHEKNNKWHVKPYAQTDFTHYNSDGFVEKGSVYDLRADDFSDNYWTGGLGIELERAEEAGTYGFQIGYERTFTGQQQRMAYSFANGTKAALDDAVSQDIGRNKIILGAYADAQLSNKWTLSGRLNKEWGDNSHAIAAQMSFNYSF